MAKRTRSASHSASHSAFPAKKVTKKPSPSKKVAKKPSPSKKENPPERDWSEFKQAAARLGLEEWIIHQCSMCESPCGFQFRDDGVWYDSGCHCSRYSVEKVSWSAVAKHYNRQNAGGRRKFDQFWKWAVPVLARELKGDCE